MSRSELGRLIVGAGAFVVLVGLLVWSGGLNWFGGLPGDIRVERDTVRVYIPLVSMLLVSVVLTVLVNLARRLF
ncbi:MAG TPA: DUF2905 domain-containing protein [Gemmatimonadales bacterium]|jgi:hypothetical protein|nr:DUF2905 domain-containing protein [Gemmatimonadales bacterium]